MHLLWNKSVGLVVISLTAAALALVLLAAPPVSAGPATDYKLHCQGCHLPDGRGMTGRVPAMKDQVAEFLCVDGGRAFLIQVPGVSMSRLSDQETADLMNWLLPAMDSDHMPTDFEPYTASEVAELRQVRETKVKDRRAALRSRIEQECIG